MEPQVTLFELIAGIGGSGVAIISAWIHMRISVGKLTTQLEYLQKEVEAEKESNKEIQKEISTKVDSIFEILSEIKVTLATK